MVFHSAEKARILGSDRVPAYSHNRLALDHFFATRPDSHSTISVIAWYLTLKNWNFSVCTRISTRNLNIFEPTRPDSTRPFDTRSDSYSTNLPLAHSLHISCEINQFREVSSCCSFLKPNSQWFRFNLIPSSISSYK